MKALPCFLICAGFALCACEVDDPSAQPPGGEPPVIDAGGSDNSVTPPPIFGGSTGGSLAGLAGGGVTGGTAAGGFIGGLGGTGLLGGLGVQVGPSGRPLRLEKLRTAATPPPPISGGTLAVSSDGRQLVASDPDRDAIFIIATDTYKVQKLSLPRGSEPGRVALDRAGGAHIALRGTGKLVRVDLASATVSTETAICAHPRGVAFDPKNSTVVATCMDGQVVSLDAASHRETARQTLASDLRDVVVSASGARWIARYRSAELLTLAADAVKSTTRPRPATTVRSQGGGLLLADVAPGELGGSQLPIVLPDSGPSTTVTLSPALAWRMVPSARGGVWMLHQQSQDDEVVITKGGYGSGCQTITSGALTEFAADGTPSRTMPIQLLGLSVDAALSPDEKWLAIASPGGFARSQATLQLYPTSNAQVVSAEPVSGGGCGSASLTTSDENQTVAVVFDGAGVLYALSREPAELQIFDVQAPSNNTGLGTLSLGTPSLMRRATIALDASSARDTGHDLFHADVGQGLACASCHGEALDDGHVWNFQKIGPRRTQNMRGGFLATAPFHWDGDMMSMSHLVDDVMTGRMGGFQVDLTFATALAGWLDQQPALTLPAKDVAAVARGRALFNDTETACSTCHSGTNFTSNESKDVGTGGTFQVPGLLGLGLRAPYMHNGCAKKLLDRFDPGCGGGDAHGKTSQLSEAQRLDLVAYLNTL